MMNLLHYTWEFLCSGGWVMIPLSVCSVVLSVLVLDRWGALRSLAKDDLTIHDAIRALDNGTASDVPGEGLRANLVRSFLTDRSHNAQLDVEILHECSLRERLRLDAALAFIGVLVVIAPLLGLLGTVLGMIQTFQVITIYGTGNAVAMASGIAIALITTEAGLLIAVPGIFLSGLLSQYSSRLAVQLEEDTAILIRALRGRVREVQLRQGKAIPARALRGPVGEEVLTT